VPALTGDPMALTPREITRRGYPLRPDPVAAPDDYTKWLKAVRVDNLTVSNRGVRDPDGLRFGESSRATWSGYYVSDPSPGTVYDSVSGNFNVPNVKAFGFPRIAETLRSSLWVGMDGVSQADTDLVQAGVSANLMVFGNIYAWAAIQQLGVWVEWIPDYPIMLPNLAVTSGDSMEFAVSMTKWDNSSEDCCLVVDPDNMHYYIYNFTKHTQLFGCIGTLPECQNAPQSGQHFVGNTAEWIMERPQVVGSSLPDLANYGRAQITGAKASDNWSVVQHSIYTDANTHITMAVAVPTLHTLSEAASAGDAANPIINFTWRAYR
jgi:hypothetical protein